METIIYANIAEAKKACEEYVAAFYALQERLGIFESCDDSCVQTYIHAKYRNEKNEIVKYTHW
jgi:hypothetical protein